MLTTALGGGLAELAAKFIEVSFRRPYRFIAIILRLYCAAHSAHSCYSLSPVDLQLEHMEQSETFSQVVQLIDIQRIGPQLCQWSVFFAKRVDLDVWSTAIL